MEAITHSQELPYILEVMLMQLVSNNQLNGWNIFENRHGHICMNIRFVVSDSHVDMVGSVLLAIAEYHPDRQLVILDVHKIINNMLILKQPHKMTVIKNANLAILVQN